MITMVVMWHCW